MVGKSVRGWKIEIKSGKIWLTSPDGMEASLPDTTINLGLAYFSKDVSVTTQANYLNQSIIVAKEIPFVVQDYIKKLKKLKSMV